MSSLQRSFVAWPEEFPLFHIVVVSFVAQCHLVEWLWNTSLDPVVSPLFPYSQKIPAINLVWRNAFVEYSLLSKSRLSPSRGRWLLIVTPKSLGLS